MNNLEEKFISRETIYNGKVLNVVKDNITLPDGEGAIREFCLHVGGVCAPVA